MVHQYDLFSSKLQGLRESETEQAAPRRHSREWWRRVEWLEQLER